MTTLGLFEVLFCGLAITLEFAVRGAAGFGAAAVIAPIAALVPAQLVIPVVAGLQLAPNTEFGIRNWRTVAWREFFRLVPVMMVGVG